MTRERRYDEDEVRQIFEAAAAAGGRADPDTGPSDGLTLPELQAIGREVGLPPERIADAARAVELGPPRSPERTLLGLPLAVGRTDPLPRAPTDREWEFMVADLRQTFRADGRVESHGRSRSWRNGRLHVYVEPAGDGYRLRSGTLKESAVNLSRAGLAVMAAAVVVSLVSLLTGDVSNIPAALGILGPLGAGFLGVGLVGLPSWARTRREQLEGFAARTRALLSEPPEES